MTLKHQSSVKSSCNYVSKDQSENIHPYDLILKFEYKVNIVPVTRVWNMNCFKPNLEQMFGDTNRQKLCKRKKNTEESLVLDS